MTEITTNELPQLLPNLCIKVKPSQTPITIAHEGKPLVTIYSATTPDARPPFGAMKGSGEILGDIIAPEPQPWEVLE
jgi:hypothetical protein